MSRHIILARQGSCKPLLQLLISIVYEATATDASVSIDGVCGYEFTANIYGSMQCCCDPK